jgi:hypothetical protein
MGASIRDKIILAATAFAVLVTAILLQPQKRLSDFDQSFYLTIAYDLDRYGVFSNGIFDNTDSPVTAPPPGMFFVPLYPALVMAAMKLDARFAKAVTCSVESNEGHRDEKTCETYARPMLIIHALLLALAVLAIATTGQLMFGGRAAFWIAGILATGSLATEADIFSFVMTESLTFALYSFTALALVLGWKMARTRHFVLAGCLLGLLCLTRPSFLVVAPVAATLILLNGWLFGVKQKQVWTHLIAFAVTFAIVLGAWMTRNAISVGKFGVSEEYGSAVLIERFAYNDMTAREFVTAFPYCTPGIGDLAFDLIYGTDSMHRFVFHTRDSFFHVGKGRRDALVKEYGKLDPLIGGIVGEEMRTNWWRHLLVSIPLGWCGMWVGWLWSLALIPLFGFACVRAVRRRQPMLLLYSAPALVMLALHALVANHYTRYNLILIGPYSVGAAWIIHEWVANRRLRARAVAPIA